MRKLLIFGNGLGRAINNDFFDLQRALQIAWDDPQVLTANQKALIRQCLPEDVIEEVGSDAPRSEGELDRLQNVLAACDEIRKHECHGGVSWLTDDGQAFPAAIRRYIHRAACHFHEAPNVLPSEFVNGLKDYLLSSRSHVATLNYDELLYRSFVPTPLFSGFSCMIDGFVPGFDKSNLDRHFPTRQSFYLHLHGSPLYYSDAQNTIRKSSMAGLTQMQGYSSSHLVLTHAIHKSAVIQASEVLSEYWRRLEEAIKEVEGIVLFGYGGGDDHLNRLIRENVSGKQLEVVERNHPSYHFQPTRQERFEYWNSLLGKSPLCFWLDNILTHTNWTYRMPLKE